MSKRMHQIPKRPELVIPALPPYLSRICLKCLEKEPANRYQSASEILVDLEFKHAPTHTRTLQITLPAISKKLSLISGSASILRLSAPLTTPPERTLPIPHTSTH